jgi:hypothetical protein
MTMIVLMTEESANAGRGIAVNTYLTRGGGSLEFSLSCIVVVACRIRRKRTGGSLKKKKKKKKEKKKEKKKHPKKFVTALKRGKGSPEKRYFN